MATAKLPPEIMDKLFHLNQRLKGTKMKELSHGEIRHYGTALLKGGYRSAPSPQGMGASPSGGMPGIPNSPMAPTSMLQGNATPQMGGIPQ